MISFVVPAHNEEPLIATSLRSIRASAEQLGLDYELIVVDDASTDATADVARAEGATVVSVEHRQIAATRNAGAAEARGERLLFVDADTVINAPLLRATVAAFDAGAVGGGCRVDFEGAAPLSWRIAIRLLEPLYFGARLAAGCYLFSTAEAFAQAGGFDTELYATEEVALSKDLAKLGRFVVLRERVLTSGRKLRTHSLGEGLGMLARLAWRGRSYLEKRDGLEIWYGPRRREPEREQT